MAKFRKIPVVVDAIQWPLNIESCAEEDPIHDKIDSWFREMGADPNKIMMMDDGTISIVTLEGEMTASPGDWIIREPFPTDDRKFYPCKPDIFAKTYQEV